MAPVLDPPPDLGSDFPAKPVARFVLVPARVEDTYV